MEGVAAYWLSLKKLVGNRRNFKGLDQEAEFTSEPFVRHLLEITFSGDMGEDRVRRCAAARGDLLRGELDRRLDLMRVAVMDVAGGENPLRTMARIAARYPVPPITTEKALGYAQELLRQAGEKPPAERFFDVSHRLQTTGSSWPCCSTSCFPAITAEWPAAPFSNTWARASLPTAWRWWPMVSTRHSCASG